MSGNNWDNLTSRNKDKCRDYHYYNLLGAPTLIYEGNRRDHSKLPLSAKNSVTHKSKKLYETFLRNNRVKARWQYELDVKQIGYVAVPYLNRRKRKHLLADSRGLKNDSNDVDGCDKQHENMENNSRKTCLDHRQHQNRLAILLEGDTNISKHKKSLESHAAYEHPYVEVESERFDHNRDNNISLQNAPRIDLATYSKGQDFSMKRTIDYDPSYLAPFDLESISEANVDDGANFLNNTKLESVDRSPQGNALTCVPCPCPSCSRSMQSYVVLHPKGCHLERLCISNLTPPNGHENAGDMKNVTFNKVRNEFFWNAIVAKPNEICLDDTILEIRQCGIWNVDNQECIFTVRTRTHVSIIKAICSQPDIKEEQRYSFPNSSCWGCYILEEKERIDLRSFSLKIPSFQPVGLTSHPRYGNEFAPCKFAFVSHSVGSSASPIYNVVHNCSFGTERVALSKHDILNLKYISQVDFSDTNPMCLWSAASSYVRPALAPGAISKMKGQKKSSFGLGSSLFTIDLRTNSATFQWSPSAEEMRTEGVHSINGILTDWFQENTVFVTSRSAGKTYEIDGRMPCRAVNTWSLTSICEDLTDYTMPSKAFYGEPSLLFKPYEQYNGKIRKSNDFFESPLLKVDTDFGANGIHLFQKPLRKPRFQTGTLECIGAAGLNKIKTVSVATSSYYGLNNLSDNTYTCGLSTMRLPLSQFVDANEDVWADYLEQKLHVLCTMTINNIGDIYCHSLLECKSMADSLDCQRFDGLPIGTSTINIPRRLDGRTKLLKNGHWKPSGGMNLNVFLSNTYPVPRKAMIFTQHEVVQDDVDKYSQSIFLNSCKKARVDESTDVFEIRKKLQKPALTIVSENRNGYQNEMLQCNGEEHRLKIPLSISQNIDRTTMGYMRGDDGKLLRTVNTDIGRDRLQPGNSLDRTDLSKTIIENALDGWDDTSLGIE